MGCPSGLTRLTNQGGVGVQLFLIASALTLMLSLDSRLTEEYALRNFFLRRYFRIAPMFYAGMIFYAIVTGGNLDPRSPRPLSVWSFITTATFTHGCSPVWINQVVPGGWSITVEMTFYLMMPLIHARLKTLPRALIATVVAYAARYAISEATLRFLEQRPESFELEGMNEAFVHYWLPHQLSRFLAGVVLYFLVRGRLRTKDHPAQSARDVIISLVLLFGSIAAMRVAIVPAVPKFFSIATCTAALVSFCCSLAVFPLPFLVNAVTRAIGKVSYSAYMTHFIVIWTLESVLQARGLMSSPYHWLVKSSAFLLSALALTMIASTLTFRFIEVPGQSLGRRVIAWLDSAKPSLFKEPVQSLWLGLSGFVLATGARRIGASSVVREIRNC